MVRGRPQAVQPAAAIFVPRRGEGAARQLLGIEAEGGPLRAVAALGQRALDRFAFEMAAEAGEIGQSCLMARVRAARAKSNGRRPDWPGTRGIATARFR